MAGVWTENATVKKGGKIEFTLPELPEGTAVRVTVLAAEAPAGEQKVRRLGSFRGLIHVSDNFDAPLPEFEGYQ